MSYCPLQIHTFSLPPLLFSLWISSQFLLCSVGSVNGEHQQQDVGEKGKNIRRVIPPPSFLKSASLITILSGGHLYTTLSVSGFWKASFPSLLPCLEVITALGNCILPFRVSTPCSHFVNSPFIKLSSSYPIRVYHLLPTVTLTDINNMKS